MSLVCVARAHAGPSESPALMLADVYRPGVDLSAYWLSEKYDGVRALWDGKQLLTRGGQVIAAPAWFTEGWPQVPMDGELWGGRGRFETTVSTVRQQTPDDIGWRAIRFMVFDLPAHPGPFSERIGAYNALVGSIHQAWVQPVEQVRVSSHEALMRRLDDTVRQGGEGLMLHRADAPYRAVRSDDLLKVKTHEDAEARVLAHEPGRGRHQGRLGALVVETPQGLRFRLGTWVTYRFRGLHRSGLPRFASFLRVRTDAEINGAPPVKP